MRIWTRGKQQVLFQRYSDEIREMVVARAFCLAVGGVHDEAVMLRGAETRHKSEDRSESMYLHPQQACTQKRPAVGQSAAREPMGAVHREGCICRVAPSLALLVLPLERTRA